MLMRLAKEIETAAKPMLIHCQQGADRSGLASVMARMAVGGKPYDRAKEQMGLKFLHIDPSSEHVGAVLTEYEDYCRDRKVDTGGWAEFRDWIFHVYRPSYHYVEFDVPQAVVGAAGRGPARGRWLREPVQRGDSGRQPGAENRPGRLA